MPEKNTERLLDVYTLRGESKMPLSHVAQMAGNLQEKILLYNILTALERIEAKLTK